MPGVPVPKEEPWGLAIEPFRRCEHVTYDPNGLREFVVESREPGTQHRLTRNIFDAWLRRPVGIARQRGAQDQIERAIG